MDTTPCLVIDRHIVNGQGDGAKLLIKDAFHSTPTRKNPLRGVPLWILHGELSLLEYVHLNRSHDPTILEQARSALTQARIHLRHASAVCRKEMGIISQNSEYVRSDEAVKQATARHGEISEMHDLSEALLALTDHFEDPSLKAGGMVNQIIARKFEKNGTALRHLLYRLYLLAPVDRLIQAPKLWWTLGLYDEGKLLRNQLLRLTFLGRKAYLRAVGRSIYFK